MNCPKLSILCCFIVYSWCLSISQVVAQRYQAIHGSVFGGGLAVRNNPAAAHSSAFSWDVALFGAQARNTTNGLVIKDWSLLKPNPDAELLFTEGNKKRYNYQQADVNLLNTRFRINQKRSVGFGFNVRQLSNARTAPFNFADSISTVKDFFSANVDQPFYQVNATAAGWGEFQLTYAQHIIDNEVYTLIGGVSAKILRSLAGGFAEGYSDQVFPNSFNGQTVYQLNRTAAQYAYSRALDSVFSDASASDNLRQLRQNGLGSFAFDIGVEYIIKPQYSSVFGQRDEATDYAWKIGVSLLDIGFAKFLHSPNGRVVRAAPNALNDTLLEQKFFGISSVAAFNDSLATLPVSLTALSGDFGVLTPARAVINVDRPMGNHFFINAELTLNAVGLWRDKRQFVRDNNLLVVTPRWEKPWLGAYLPLTITQEGKFIAGAAMKLGPLLLGMHNLGNLFSKNSMPNTGGYIALLIHPGSFSSRKSENGGIDCPK